MERKFLKGCEFERLITEDKFTETTEITVVELLRFKQNRLLLVKVPSSSNEKNPYDGFKWSKTKYNNDKKIDYRHQPSYGKLKLFGEEVTCIKCTDFDNSDIRKQVVTYKDFTYCYYFATGISDIHISDEPRKRLDKWTRDQLRQNIMPMRSVSNAVKMAREIGISVTKKQVSNLARSTSDVILQKMGPRSKTSLKMAEELQALNPDRVWFEKDDLNILTDFTFIRTFKDGLNIYVKGCPSRRDFDKWLRFVELVENSNEERRKRIVKEMCSKTPNGVFFPSRLHVDTTFKLGDVYVTFVLGETKNFKTLTSGKPRVIPLGFMLHSSKKSENHLKFARILKSEFENVFDTADRQIPCVLLDGEHALEHYPEVLESRAIRCDLHILSLLSFEHGGKTAVRQAKPFLFGKMKNGKWRTGLLGCFDQHTFDRRLRHIEQLIDPKIVEWLKTNQNMLMECASAIAKLRGGHLLQFSTNNQNETFNGIVKNRISRQQSLPDLVKKLDNICSEKLRECWLSGIDGSEHVYFASDVEDDSLKDKIIAYSSAGLISCRTLALRVPLRVAEGFHLEKLNREELAVAHLRCTRRQGNIFHLENTLLPDDDRKRFSQVQVTDDSRLECWQCVVTLPHFICSHVIYCLCEMRANEVNAYWRTVLPPKPTIPAVNAFSGKSGLKPSDRIGTSRSARNHIRKIADISSISIFTNSPTTSPPAQNSSFNHSLSSANTSHITSPIASTSSDSLQILAHSQNSPSTSDAPSRWTSDSSVRRSQRKKKPLAAYSPSHDSTLNSYSDNSTVF